MLFCKFEFPSTNLYRYAFDVARISSYTEENRNAPLLAMILSPLVGKNGYALKNSAAMVEELSLLTLCETDVLVSFDVTALFTKVPVDKSLDIVLDRLEKDASLNDRIKLSPVQIRDLMRTCLKTTYI